MKRATVLDGISKVCAQFGFDGDDAVFAKPISAGAVGFLANVSGTSGLCRVWLDLCYRNEQIESVKERYWSIFSQFTGEFHRKPEWTFYKGLPYITDDAWDIIVDVGSLRDLQSRMRQLRSCIKNYVLEFCDEVEDTEKFYSFICRNKWTFKGYTFVDEYGMIAIICADILDRPQDVDGIVDECRRRFKNIESEARFVKFLEIRKQK